MVWMVFLEADQRMSEERKENTHPSPISSARMQLRFLLWMLTSHSSPVCWYGRNIPRSSAGGFIAAAGSHSTGATAYGFRYRGIRVACSDSSSIADEACSAS